MCVGSNASMLVDVRAAAVDAAAALGQLPRYVAGTSTATRVDPIAVP